MVIRAPSLVGRVFVPIPEGQHLGFCDLIVDLGFQNSQYCGKPVVRRQLYIGWQIPAVRTQWRKNGRDHEGPARIKRIYTLSLEKGSHLRDAVERWRGTPFGSNEEAEAFDLTSLIGAPAKLVVEHEFEHGHTYARLLWPLYVDESAVGDVTPEGTLVVYDADHAERLIDLPGKVQDLLAAQVQQPLPAARHKDNAA